MKGEDSMSNNLEALEKGAEELFGLIDIYVED